MKHLSLLLCVTLFAVSAPTPTAHAQADVGIDFFYDALDPQGAWIYTPNYGYVWEPAVAQQQNDWAPYSDGYWAYTDAGWTWISNEDFGWATYHYGRWVRMFSRWFWVPGYEWAPAWVSWRQSDDYVGWAPLPPEAGWSGNIGFSSWTDSYYDIGPSYYSFVPMASFATRASLRPFIVDRRRNVTYVDRSVNITNITYQQNVVNNIFVGGPDPARIERFGGNPVRRLKLRRDDADFRRDWVDNRGPRPRNFGSLSRIDRDELLVAAPNVRRDGAPSLPPRVKERFDRPEVDRGWKDVGDRDIAERLRGKQREELAKAKAERMPEKTPLITSAAPPPAVGRQLNDEERKGRFQRPDGKRVDEEVRKAEPPPGSPRGVTERPPQPDSKPRGPGMPDRDAPSPQVIPGERPGPLTPGKPDVGRPRVPGTDRPDGDRPDAGRPRLPGSDRPDGNRPDADKRRDLPSIPQPQEPRTTPPRTSREIPENRIPEGTGRDGKGPEGRKGPPNSSGRPTPPNVSPDQPRVPPVPIPQVRPEPRDRPAPMPRTETPKVKPAPMPQPTPPPQVRPQIPQNRPQIPENRPAPNLRPPQQPRMPEARPAPAPQPRQPEARPAPPPQKQPRPQGGPPGGRKGPEGKKPDGRN